MQIKRSSLSNKRLRRGNIHKIEANACTCEANVHDINALSVDAKQTPKPKQTITQHLCKTNDHEVEANAQGSYRVDAHVIANAEQSERLRKYYYAKQIAHKITASL